MVRYSKHPKNASKSVKARGANLRVSFKNTCETANAIKGMTLKRAFRFLTKVKRQQECVPYRRFKGGVSRHGQIE